MLAKINEILRQYKKRKENNATAIKYYNMEEVTVTGFCNFCRNNIPLIITVSIALFLTYGIRLFWYSIGTDTELFMTDKSGFLRYDMSIERFGLALLSKIWYINEFNPFTSFFTAFCLIWFFTMSWCYIIAVFSRDTGRNNRLIPFALVFMTMPVWAEMFSFLFIAAENALIISLCPYIIYLLFKGFLDNEKRNIICASILLVFMISVYQAIVPMFCCGVFIHFVLLQENTKYDSKVYRNLCLKLFIALLASLMLYFFIAQIILAVFQIEKASYVDQNFQLGNVSIRDYVFRILAVGYTLTVGHIPLFQRIVNPIIASYGGAYSRTDIEMIEFIVNISRIHGNILLLPTALFFLIKIASVMRKTIPSGRRLLYMLAGIGIPLCIMLMTIVTGYRAPMRTFYALPLAFAFMLFYLIRTYKKKAAFVVAGLSLLIAVHQAQITAQLFYSDYMRYNEDVRFAYELNNLITQVQPGTEYLPVAIVGRYPPPPPATEVNLIKGDSIGDSFFNVDWRVPKSTTNRTKRVLAFMKILGINYDMPDEDKIERAIKEAVSMPPYPDPGCVKRMEDYIVVKLSEKIWEED